MNSQWHSARNLLARAWTRFGQLAVNTHTITGGRLKGVRIAPGDRNPAFLDGSYEAPVQDALADRLNTGDVFYDVGANIGFFSLLAASCVGPTGRVYAFEPVAANAALIRKSAALNAIAMIDVFEEAVGDLCGEETLLLARNIGGASLASVGPPPDMRGEEKVQVTTLDDAIVQRRLRPPSLVKIDVEGAEANVLAGMKQTLAQHHPILLLEFDDAEEAGLKQKSEVAEALLREANYTWSWLPDAYAEYSWCVGHCVAVPAEG